MVNTGSIVVSLCSIILDYIFYNFLQLSLQSINIRNVRKKRHSIFKFDGLGDQKEKKSNYRHPVYTISFVHTAGTCFPLEIQPISRAEGGKDLIQAQAHVPKYRTKGRGCQFDSSILFSLYRRL